MKKQLVLIGGGHAHVHVLKSLTLREPQPFEGVEVTLISPYARQVYSGMLPGWVAGHYAIEQCVIPLRPLAARGDVRFHPVAATKIDFARSVVHCEDGQEIAFDLLSIDSGPVANLSMVPGLAEHAIAIRPIETFIDSYAAVAGDIDARHRRGERTRVAFVGAGAGGVELALAMQHRFRKHDVGVTLISAANTLPGSVGPRIARIMRSRGMAVLAGQAAANVTQAGVRLDSGAMVDADVVIAATGASAADWPRASGLLTDEHGFILVNEHLQSISHANVFAAGDCATMQQHPRPKSGVYAVKAGAPLDDNLRRALRGDTLQRYLPQARSLYLISTGNKYAIGSWGDLAWEGAWVWHWKDMIDRGFMRKYSLPDNFPHADADRASPSR